MGITCPACGTENRSIAKFCIECIEPLPTVFAPTEIYVRPGGAAAAAAAATATGLPAPLAPPAKFAFPPAAAPAAPSAAPPPATAPRRIAEPRKGLWVSVAAFGIAMAIGAAGWLVAGAGGLYIYSFGARPKAPAPGAAAAVAPAPPVPAPSGALPLSSTEIITELASDRATPTASVAAASVAVPEPARAASAAGAVRPKAKASPPATPPLRTANLAVEAPDTQCNGLGFFARARCMADQCLKPAYRPHAQCEAVRQQQQLMEEKRNPTGGGA